VSAFIFLFILTFLVTFGLKDLNITPVEFFLCSVFSVFLVLEVYILHLFENYVKQHMHGRIFIHSLRSLTLVAIVVLSFMFDYLLEIKFGENWELFPFYWLWAYPASYFLYYLAVVPHHPKE
jgi:hypothetical protein